MRWPSKDLVQAAQISKSADVGDDERDAKLIFCAHHSQIDAAVFHRKSATSAIVIQHHELILQRGIQDVVTKSGSDIEALAREAAVADDGANLVGGGLDDWIALLPEVRHGHVKLSVRLNFQQRPNRRYFVQLCVVNQDLLGIKLASWR